MMAMGSEEGVALLERVKRNGRFAVTGETGMACGISPSNRIIAGRTSPDLTLTRELRHDLDPWL